MQSVKNVDAPPITMTLIKLLLLAALIATIIVFFAEGPDLLDIINRF